MAFFRCGSGSGGGGETVIVAPEISGQFGNKTNGLLIQNGRYISGFNTSNLAFFPKTANANWPTYDFTKPYKFNLRFRWKTVPTAEVGLYGPDNNFRQLPLTRANARAVYNTYSTDGSNAVTSTIYYTDVPAVIGKTYDLSEEWSNGVFTFTFTDGTNSKTITQQVAHRYSGSTSSIFQIGTVNNSTSLVSGIEVDMQNTYFENDGVVIWGNKERKVFERSIENNPDMLRVTENGDIRISE